MTSSPPPLGQYWSARKPRMDAGLETIRRASTFHLDNAARLPSASSVQHAWNRCGTWITDRFLPLVNDSPRGCPPRFPLYTNRGLFETASVSSIEFAAMASRLVPVLEERNAARVVEIGGGYGGLAAAALASMPALEAWCILDIPEVGRVSSWYLEDEPRASVMMPDGEPGPADVLVQTRGFMEMSDAELAWYFDRIQNATLLKPDGALWTINRLKKVSRFVAYPFDLRWRVIYVSKWPEGDMIEVLLERTATDQPRVPAQLAMADIR